MKIFKEQIIKLSLAEAQVMENRNYLKHSDPALTQITVYSPDY